MEGKNNQIVIYNDKDKKVKVEAVLKKETVWLSLDQMSVLFDRDKSVISRHLKNVFIEKELKRSSVVAKNATTASDGKVYNVDYYNLDVIISVGYRVKSKNGTKFRIWATKVLRDHIIKGITINKERLNQLQGDRLNELESAVTLIRRTIENKQLTGSQERGLLQVITEYTNSWVLLTKYDNQEITAPKKVSKLKYSLTYDEVRKAIDKMRQQLAKKLGDSDLYGKEREAGLKSIIGAINQTYARKPLYPSIEHQASHLLYFVIKDHPFVDGNKRIGAFLFIYYLSRCNYLLKKNGEKKINDNALVALTLLVAESDPKEKEVIVKLIMNFIVK
jgi:prophage maintenance system killer protein